jgi:hypothetical protein
MTTEEGERLRGDPRRVLARAGWWLVSAGIILAVAGAVVVVRALVVPGDSRTLWRVLGGVGGFVGWFVPGVVYVVAGLGIRRRKRWAITAADVSTYIQFLFAGILVVISLLSLRHTWHLLVIALAWVAPLLATPWLTAPCSRAMDLIAQLPTLGVEPVGRAIREKRR